jgi:hypothetical protein
MANKKLTAPQLRIKKQKDMLIEFLKKNPVVQAACEKLEIGRATHYRWCKEDAEYAKQVDEAIVEGITLCNDYAESQLLSAIQSGDTNATKFFLRANHPRYKNKIEITEKRDEPLTPEQKELAETILKRIGATKVEPINIKADSQNNENPNNQ